MIRVPRYTTKRHDDDFHASLAPGDAARRRCTQLEQRWWKHHISTLPISTGIQSPTDPPTRPNQTMRYSSMVQSMISMASLVWQGWMKNAGTLVRGCGYVGLVLVSSGFMKQSAKRGTYSRRYSTQHADSAQTIFVPIWHQIAVYRIDVEARLTHGQIMHREPERGHTICGVEMNLIFDIWLFSLHTVPRQIIMASSRDRLQCFLGQRISSIPDSPRYTLDRPPPSDPQGISLQQLQRLLRSTSPSALIDPPHRVQYGAPAESQCRRLPCSSRCAD